MLDSNKDILLGDFGGTKDQASIHEGGPQTGTYSWGWADMNARFSKFDYKSEVYAFGLNAYYILHGEPLFSRQDANAYLNNETKNEKGNNRELLRSTINRCLNDDPNQRPSFKILHGEVFYYIIEELCRNSSDDDEFKTVKLILTLGTRDLVNHYNTVDKNTPLMFACRFNQASVVEALIGKGADPNFLGVETALHFAANGRMECVEVLVEAGTNLN